MLKSLKQPLCTQRQLPNYYCSWVNPDNTAAVVHRIEENQRPDYKIFVAAVNQQVAGVIAVHTYTYLHTPGQSRIMTFCVDESLRGSGIGTQLLTHAEKYLAEKNCIKVDT